MWFTGPLVVRLLCRARRPAARDPGNVPARTRRLAARFPVGVSRQGLALKRDLSWSPSIESLSRNDWPWSTIPSAYIGMLPLRRQPRSQVEVQIYRVSRDFIARSPAP